MSDTPRRSPRIAERSLRSATLAEDHTDRTLQEKYGASPRNHIALGDEHPYKEMLRTKRYPYDDEPQKPKESGALCALTALVTVAWMAFFGSVFFDDWKRGRTPFSWELGSTFNHPFSFP